MIKFSIEYENRQIIPRWLPYTKSQIVINSEYINSRKITEIETLNYKKIVNDWVDNKSISFAIQLLATADILGFTETSEYKEALLFIKKNKHLSGENYLLFDFLDENNGEKCQCNDIKASSNIKGIKIKLINNSKDSILWTDLAYYYAIIGNNKKAERCIKIALNLNNYNAHIVRSAARFYIRQENPEKALSIIRKSPNILVNPMILSSEIAISEAFDLKTKLVKKGQALAYENNFSQEMLSELNGTIATIEYNRGNSKYGKKYVNNALIKPNENTLAQIQFLYDKNNIDFSPQKYNVPCRFEADTWNFYQNYKYAETVAESEKWHNFQPLSAKPVILNAYVRATHLNDHEGAISIIDEALKINSDTILLNNKAFSLAKLNRIKEAQEVIEEIEKDIGSISQNPKFAILKATLGLIKYREGNPDRGRQLYQEAIDYFSRNKNFAHETRALYFWYTEEKKYNTELATRIKGQIDKLIEQYNIKEIKMLLSEKNK